MSAQHIVDLFRADIIDEQKAVRWLALLRVMKHDAQKMLYRV